MTDNTINKERTSPTIGDQQSTVRSKKKPWQWAVDAVVWVACVVALCLVLFVPSENMELVNFVIELRTGAE